MNKPIAVVSSNYEATRRWLTTAFKIVSENLARRILIDEAGVQYIIVTEPNYAIAFEFSAVMVAPDYQTLLDVVRQRIR